jgi:hypothetical protein
MLLLRLLLLLLLLLRGTPAARVAPAVVQQASVLACSKCDDVDCRRSFCSSPKVITLVAAT